MRRRRVYRSIKWAGVVLAAGTGTRMKSSLPKVLHKICGKEMLLYPIAAARDAGVQELVVVVSPESHQVKGLLKDSVRYAVQKVAKGTGHALSQAVPLLSKIPGGDPNDASKNELFGAPYDCILVLNADLPLIQPSTLKKLMLQHIASGAVISLLTCKVDAPQGLGRVLRNKDGSSIRIVEDKDADDSERLINEINVGAYCFKVDWLWPELQKLRRSNNETGEIYLVDLIERASKTGHRVFTVETSDQNEALGVNTRVHLAQAEQALRQRIRERHMLAGVTMLDPATTYIDSDARFSEDVTLYPNTSILGKTTVGRQTVIGPGATISDSRIGTRCQIGQSTIEGAVIEDRVDIGPYCHIRPGSRIESGVRLGNYVEVKNSRIGRDTQSGHFSYIGDATVGRGVNIGAGTITCNFDGKRKHRTIIGDNAFIGSDTMLIAPVKIGRGSRTGAGAVVTHDVAPGDTVIGVPARGMKPKK